jgi:phosphate transport system permease protein
MATVQPGITLQGDRRSARRKWQNWLAEGLATLAALAAIAVLVIVVWSVAKRGASELSWSFLTSDLPLFGLPGGGIKPLIVGSAILVLIATAIALPLGVLTALFLTEFASKRVASAIQLTLDLMNGLPSVIIGVFVFGLLVDGHKMSGYAGGFALSVVMLPLVARSTQEVLRLVPSAQREGALALGASRWRTVIGIVLPSSLGGIACRRRNRPAAVHDRDLREQPHVEPDQCPAQHPGPDLHLVRVARSRGSQAGLGVGTRADDLRPRHERDRAGAACPE